MSSKYDDLTNAALKIADLYITMSLALKDRENGNAAGGLLISFDEQVKELREALIKLGNYEKNGA